MIYRVELCTKSTEMNCMYLLCNNNQKVALNSGGSSDFSSLGFICILVSFLCHILDWHHYLRTHRYDIPYETV